MDQNDGMNKAHLSSTALSMSTTTSVVMEFTKQIHPLRANDDDKKKFQANSHWSLFLCVYRVP